jgi:hypothetical protein
MPKEWPGFLADDFRRMARERVDRSLYEQRWQASMPVVASVRRVCPGAEGMGCGCTGACREPISRDQEIAALRQRLAELGAR